MLKILIVVVTRTFYEYWGMYGVRYVRYLYVAVTREVSVAGTRTLTGLGRDAADSAPEVRMCSEVKSGLRSQKLTARA